MKPDQRYTSISLDNINVFLLKRKEEIRKQIGIIKQICTMSSGLGIAPHIGMIIFVLTFSLFFLKLKFTKAKVASDVLGVFVT